MTQNDPKMTPKWPQNDQKSIFSKMFLHHFWPFLGWFGVILGCFERVLVIFGPRNAFKWPYLGSKMAQKWAKNRFFQKWFTWLLGILGVVWGHFRLLWAVIWLQRPQNDPKTTPKRPKTTQNDPKRPKMTPKWPKMSKNRFFQKMFLNHLEGGGEWRRRRSEATTTTTETCTREEGRGRGRRVEEEGGLGSF